MLGLDESKFTHAIDEIDYNKYVDIEYIDLRMFLATKSVGRRRLRSGCNSGLLSIMISMMTHKNPKNVVGRLENVKNDSRFPIILDDIVGTIFPIKPTKIKCNMCLRDNATYEHVLKSTFNCVYKTVVCTACLDICINQSNEWLYELAKPKILELYFLFKQTDIYNHLIHDVSSIIFKLLLY
jgi:hypothetical protein